MIDKVSEQKAEVEAQAVPINIQKIGNKKVGSEEKIQSMQTVDEKQVDGKEKKHIQEKKEEDKVSFFEMFRFANKSDKTIMIIGSICALINGLCLPAFCVIMGKLINGFGPDSTADDMVESAFEQLMYFLGIAAISFLLSWAQMYAFMNSGEKQAIKFRIEYFKAILRQDISWFDETDPNQLSMKIATETFAIQGAIGEKIPTFVQTLATVIGGFVVGYLYGWELALVCTAIIPFLGLAATIFTIFIQTAEASVADTYTDAGGKAEQAMFGVKTVKSLNGQEHEQKRYLKSLMWAYKKAYKDGIKIGLGLGFLFFFMIGANALGFWVGSEFIADARNNAIQDRPYNVGDVLTVFFAIMIGGMNVGQTTPCLEKFSLGQAAAYKVLKVIDNKPKISPSLHKGETIKNVKGEISFNDVEFTYPTKQDVQVLKKINFKIQPGKKTALVGESGCGKSTCMQLVERFYDADKGSVTVDGLDIKKLNLAWYRENVGYVGQEPVLFAGSIRENMRYGKPDATEEEMIQALKHARAWDFVNQMSDKLDTLVGNSGGQLSGGQKQRICIARAILKSPPILLLDEATSALDRQNEQSIQKTLDEVSTGRTTLVIAHRLSTIKNSDEIIVIDSGKVVERGTHDYLVSLGGKYAALSKNQQKAEQEEQENRQHLEEDGVQVDDNDSVENAPQVKNNSSVHWNKSALHKKPKANNSMVVSKLQENDENGQKKEQKISAKEKGSIFKKLISLNSQEWPLMVVGTIASSVVGAVHPVSGILMGKLLIVLSSYGTDFYDEDDYKSDRDLYCILYIVLAACAAIASVFQVGAWRKVGQGLTYKLREKAFAKIMKMRPDWFDFAENSAGVLSSRLGSDTQIVNGLASTVLNIQISNLSSLIVGVIIAAYYEWRICLIALFFFPFIVLAGMMQAAFVQGFGDKTDEAYKNSGNLVQDAVVNMRTVNSFGNEKFIQQTYADRLEGPRSIITEKALKTGISYGASQFVMFVVMGLMFYIGSLLVRDVGIEVEGMYIGLFAIMNAAMGTGNNNQFMTDVGQAFNAATSLFSIYESEDEEQYNAKICPNPIKIEQMAEFKGHIKFSNVFFKYPTRNKYVLNGISFEIKPGQKVAFVGPSGCGKSTVMQLLQRFYEIESGTITIDGRNLNEYDIFSLRAQYGVVSQEPILFNGTIKENIEYNTPNLSFDEIKHLAKLANAADFIEKDEGDVPQNLDLKEIGRGYDRQVGNKGGSLSGGQKQRIAIARAIAKNPKILFLDEATSALDNENEKKVQASLDQLMKGRTTLAVAHRISTIADSDKIFVFENGHIMEEGTYPELVAKKNYFYRLERGEQK